MENRVDPLAVVGGEESPPRVVGARVDGGVGAEPLDQRPLLLAGGKPDHLRPGPLAELHRERAGAAGGSLDQQRLAGLDPRAAPHQRHRGDALQQQRRRLIVVDLVRNRDQHLLGHDDLLRIAPTTEQRRHPLPIRRTPADLGPGDQRQLLLSQIIIPGRMRIGKVDPRPSNLYNDRSIAGLGIGQLYQFELLRPTELLYLDGSHGGEP